MIKKLLVGIVMVMVMMGSAYALDKPACQNFPHQWGENIKCEGKYEVKEMGSFDPDGNWKWNTDFQNEVMQALWSPFESWESMTPAQVTGITPVSARLDNKRWPESMSISGRTEGARIVFQGAKGGVMAPSIWKSTATDPGENCSGNWCWHGHDGLPYPQTVVHIDWNTKPICQDEFCNNDGCDFDECGPDGCVELTASDGTICSFNHPDNSPVPYLFDSVMMETQGSVPVTWADISHVEWIQGGQTATPWWTEYAHYWEMSYDTDLNMLAPKNAWGPTAPRYDDHSIYFNHFNTLVGPVGIHDFILHFNGTDQKIPLKFNVDTLQTMPTVDAQSVIEQTFCKKVKKNRKNDDDDEDDEDDRDDDDDDRDDDRKKVKREKCFSTEAVVDNLKAKVITSNHGTERLLIQWNEPEGAMILTPSVRLRIFVGNGWMEIPDQGGRLDYHFLWTDAPLHSGSVVIPSEQWEWVKQEMRYKGLNYVEIGGMYREQRGSWPMTTYHNRGYIHGIVYTFE